LNKQIIFHEKQRFNQWWLIAIVLGLNGFFFVSLFWQFVLKKPLGDKPMEDWSLIVTAAVNVSITVLFFLVKLETHLEKDLIVVRFFPLLLKPRKIYRSEVKTIFVREYKPIQEYGGWGIKGSSNNRAYNISGKIGLQIIFNDGKKLLIGTKKKAELETIIKQWQ
jgi:Family of unknown function (DUF6141)